MLPYPLRSVLAAVAAITYAGFCTSAFAQTPAAQPPTGQPPAATTEPPPPETATTTGQLTLELNRLENQPRGCRIYLVFGNNHSAPIETLRLDLVLFGRDGVIQRRLAVDAGPLRADRRTVKLFDVTDTNCDGIGSILVNDIPQCSAGADCLSQLAVSSRADIPLNK